VRDTVSKSVRVGSLDNVIKRYCVTIPHVSSPASGSTEYKSGA
jgi:hypothetical protein